MSDADDDVPATLQRVDTGWQGRTQRRWSVAPARLWAMLTSEALLPLWLAPGSVEPRLGGAVALRFTDSGTVIESTVTACEAGSLLAYSWSRAVEPQRPVCWTLSDADAGTLLSLTVEVPQGEDIGRACAGFDAHLQMLKAALDGAPIGFPFAYFKRMREAYKSQLACL